MKLRFATRAAAFIAVGMVAAALPLAPAGAQEPVGVTLAASKAKIDYGGTTKLSGAVDPPTADQPVQIVDQAGAVVAEATTDEEGEFRVRLNPEYNVKLRARWLTTLSDPVAVKVRPLIEAKLRDVFLFDRARVKGSLRPAHPGERVAVALIRHGKTVASRDVVLEDGKRFAVRFDIKKPGKYKAKASFDDADHLPAKVETGRKETPLPALSQGSESGHVKRLEKRLLDLAYYLPKANKEYDAKTSDAVRAFNKVQGRDRSGSVSEGTWRALADPRKPKPAAKKPTFHIEVDQTKQVLYTVKGGKITNILHVSTGAGGATRDGVWTVYRKTEGYSGGGLYYPSYFDELRAIHGWEDVPTYNASHGCVRVPMWAAEWIYGKADIGTKVRIYH